MIDSIPPQTDKKPAESRARGIWRQVRVFAFIFVIFAALRSAVADWNDVPTGSMIPTILEGDRIFVNKLAYDLKVPFTTMHVLTWDNPRRGDIVVFFSPDEGTRLVKRVIALPGDTVELRDNRLILNGIPCDYQPVSDASIAQLDSVLRNGKRFAEESEPSATHPHPVMGDLNIRDARRSFPAIVVPAGDYFMMGDNRDNSRDSRYFGFVPREQIVGRAVGVVASLDINHHWVPRWGRFFTLLN